MATEFITDIIDPPELIGFVREATANGRPFDPWLPPRSVDDIEYEVQNIDMGASMQVARYRSWDAVPSLGVRPGLTITGGEIPPLGRSLKMNERDVLRMERLRAGVGETSDSRVYDTIYNDAANMAQAVNNRLTWAVSDLLVDGALTIESNITGSTVVATFDVPAGRKGVTPGIAWSTTATAVPITNLIAWDNIVKAANGGKGVDFWITSSPVMADLTINAQIRNRVPANADGSVRGFVNAATVNQVFLNEGVAPIVTVDLELPHIDTGVMTRVLPVRQVIGVIINNLGNVLFAPSPNAALMAGNGTISFADAAGVIAFVERSIRPASVLTTGEAVALPILRNPKGLFSASV